MSIPARRPDCPNQSSDSGIPRHDAPDGNGDAHLKAGLVGLSEAIPPIDGRLGLSRWQTIFFCEFDGPRRERRIVRTVIADRQPL